MEYKFHDNKSDFGDDRDKGSYISVKLPQKDLDSNVSSPSPEGRGKHKQPPFQDYNDRFKYKEFTSNLMTKHEKKIFELDFFLFIKNKIHYLENSMNL